MHQSTYIASVALVGLLAACGGSEGEIPRLPDDMPANATSATLGATWVRQAQPSWCWLAVTEMVVNAYGIPMSQCEIANQTFAHFANNRDYAAAATVDCCDPAEATTASACNVGGNVRWSADALGLDTAGLDRPLSEDELQLTLTNGRAVGMGVDIVRGSRKKDHVRLINSYDVNRGAKPYEVLDSEFSGPEFYAYNDLAEWHSQNYVTTWDKSYIVLRP